MEAMQVLVADWPHKMHNIKKEVTSNHPKDFGVKATQMETMKALVGDLPVEDDHADRKGNTTDIPNWVGNADDDDRGEDNKLLLDCKLD